MLDGDAPSDPSDPSPEPLSLEFGRRMNRSQLTRRMVDYLVQDMLIAARGCAFAYDFDSQYNEEKGELRIEPGLLFVKLLFGKSTNTCKSKIHEILAQETDRKTRKVILLFECVTPKVLDSIPSKTAEAFKFGELSHMPLKNCLQPASTRILSAHEKALFLKQHVLEDGNLPRIKKSDIVCRMYAARQGDVFEFKRRDGHHYFRIVG